MTNRNLRRMLLILLCAIMALGLPAVAAHADGITTWAELQAAFNAGGTITLTQNVVAGENDGPLTVPEGKTVILDLKGFGIDRNLYEAVLDGYVLYNAGSLTIKDTSRVQTGSISGGYNSEYEDDGVVPFGYNRGGGIYNTGTLRLEGGDITGNRAKDNAGVFNASGATFTMTGGMISDNTSYLMGGSGITNYGTFTMTGGTITGNSAVTRGGGVWSIGSFTMTGGTISGNTAGNNGGGLCVRYGTATISGGSITGNSATGATPGDENTTVTGCGGGLYIDQGGDVTFTGGSITGNSAGNHGGDIFLNAGTSWNSSLKMSGSPVASVCLAEGKVITVTGKFTEDAEISVATVAGTGVITSGYGANNANDHPGQYFRASDTANGILLGDGEAVLGAGTVVHDVSYVERRWNGTAVVSAAQTRDAVAVPTSGNMTSGWYVLNSNVTKNGRVQSITGDVHLILGDGYTLDVKGLYVPAGSTLTIYGQAEGTGRLYSHPSGGAAIGGYSEHDNGNIVIHGGTIEAYGYDNCAGIGSNDGSTGGSITIYGGNITAEGGSDGAAIGGGRNCSGGNITIYGGNITANGPSDSDTCENGAGIGGGVSGAGGTIAIYGGTITTYSRDGAGIGGGDDGDGGNITIYGGTITSTKVNQGQGARIGGGCDAAPGTITIHGGTITTVGGDGAGIGGGKGNTAGGSVAIYGGTISASGSYGIGSGKSGAGVAVTLGYTAATRDTVSITASSYGGTVTLENPFALHTYSRTFAPGAVSDISLLGGGALTYWSGEVLDWQTLQATIDGASDGAIIALGQNVYADYSSDAALHVSSSRNITIDLNGYTIDRGLSNRDASVYGNEGYVIKNEGTLTITDTMGTGAITGGNCSAAGGGIYNSGTLTISGGSITGNAASTWGGGIYLPDSTGATLHLNGGSITNNTCVNNGGGVHVSGKATMTISGSPVVTGNTKKGAANNINLATNAVLTVSGALTDGANLCVSASGGTATITSGYGAKNGTAFPGAYFHADSENYGVGLQSGEAAIMSLHTITILNGVATANKSVAVEGEPVVLTASQEVLARYTNQQGQSVNLQLTPGENNTYTFVMPDADVTVYVELTWADLQAMFDEAAWFNSVTVVLPNNITASADDNALCVDSFGDVTLDLNGFTLSRGLTEAKDDGQVINVGSSYYSATLTIRDSSAGQTGMITGANCSEYGAVVVNSSSTLTLESGGIIGNTGYRGAGVYVDNNATFIMNQGSISENTASYGSVFVQSGGTFTMNSGSITNNTSMLGGGVFVMDEATFSMHDGFITNNTASGAAIDDGTLFSGGGVFNIGTFSMEGGYITSNNGDGIGGGVLHGGGSFTMSGGSITLNKTRTMGSGVYSNASMTMTGGSISNNTTEVAENENREYDYSGGLVVGWGSFTVSGAPVIKDNTYNRANYQPLKCDIQLAVDTFITVAGPLTAGAKLVVFPPCIAGYAVTSGLKTYGGSNPLAAFDINNLQAQIDSGYPFHIMLDANGEAVVGYEWKVRYLANDGTNRQEEYPAILDMTAYKLLPNMFGESGGQYFYAWEVNGEQYVPGAGIPLGHVSIDEMATNPVEAKAVWGGPYYTVSFNKGAEDASGEMLAIRTAQAEPYTLPVCAFTPPEHMMFAGWLVGEDTVEKPAGEQVTLTGDTTLTATWRLETVGVFFDANGGEGSMEDTELDYGAEYTLPDCGYTAPEGRYFGGWLVGDGTEVFYPGDVITVTGETIVKARWGGLWSHLQMQLKFMSGDSLTLTLPGSVTAEAGDTALVIPEGKTVVLDLNGYTLDRGQPQNNDSAIIVLGALTVRDSSTAKTGVITGGTNSGVYVGSMTQGEYPWVYIYKAGHFTLESGTISNNSTSDFGSRGGGVHVDDGTFTMNGGNICNNSAYSGGGGVYVHSTNIDSDSFIMTGGSIADNIAFGTACRGGGVYLWEISGRMSGGEISGNVCENHNPGGGLYLFLTDFTLSGGRIVNNTATGGGGGVDADCYANETDFTLTITGGEISGNTAGYNGGGIEAFTHLVISGGTITDNTGDLGGGVILDSAETELRLSGAPVITGNKSHNGTDSNLFIVKNAVVINDSLSADAQVGVTVWKNNEILLPDENGAIIFTSGLSGNGTAASFTSDDSAKAVGLNAAGEAILGTPATVTFASGDETATGEMEAVTVAKSSVYALPVCEYSVDGRSLECWSVQVGESAAVSKQPGETVEITANTSVTAVWLPGFGTPDFVIPSGTLSIGANAFENIAATVVDIPAGCTSIGDEAFKSCGQLTMIRIPSGCALGTDVFAGCAKVYVFGAAGSDAERYCGENANCVFVEEAQN